MSTRFKESLVAVATVAAVTILFFFPLLKGSTFTTVVVHERATYPWRGVSGPVAQPYPQTDQADLSLPWHTFETRTLRHGVFPFWDADSYAGGYPFFANGSSAVLYPVRLILAETVDPHFAHALFSVIHIFLAGIFMYALMKELGAGLAGSLFAAVAWMLSGFVLAWLHLEVVAPMAVFVPLDLLVVRRAFRRGSGGAVVIAGITLGLTLMAGHLILLGIVWLTAVLYATAIAAGRIIRARRGKGRFRPAAEAGRLAAIVAVSLGTAAVVLLPTVSVVSSSARDPFTYGRLLSTFLAKPRDFAYALSPPPLPLTMERMHQMAFAGTITAVFAAIGFFARRPGGWLGRAITTAVFAIAVGTPATWLVYHFVPGFQVFRPYSRLLILWTFGVALLGGLGLDVVVRRLWRPAGRSPSDETTSRRNGQRLLRPAAAAIAVAAIVATTFQLGRYGRDINPPFVNRNRAAEMYAPTPVIERAIQETDLRNAWPGRVLPLVVVRTDGTRPGPTLFAAHHLLFGLDSAGGYDSVLPRRTSVLLRLLQGDDPGTILRSGLSTAYAPRFNSDRVRFDLLRKAGITAIVATPRSKKPEAWSDTWRAAATSLLYDGPDGRLFRLLGAPAGPTLVSGQQIVPSESAALRRFIDPGFDDRTSVILERADLKRAAIDESTLRDGPLGAGRIVSARRGVNSVRVVAHTNSASWLVIPDTWSPGWTARVDGKPAPILRANYLRRAVRVPAGRSVVTMRYRPPHFALGAGITLATLILGVAAPVLWRRRRAIGGPAPSL